MNNIKYWQQIMRKQLNLLRAYTAAIPNFKRKF